MQNSKTVFKNKLLYTLLLVPIFEPDFFKEIAVLDYLFIALKFLVLVIVAVKYVCLKKVGKFSYWIALYCGGLILVTAVNGQDIFFAVKKIIECFLVAMLLEIGVYYNGKKAMKWIFDYLFFLMVVNLLLIVPFPNGLLAANYSSENYKLFFLCIKNGMINWMALEFVLGQIYLSYTADRIFEKKFAVFLIIATITMIYTGSSTGIIIFAVLLLYYFISKIHEFNFSLGKIMPWLVAGYLAIIVFRVQKHLNDLFMVLFGKDASFSGRDNLWDHAIYYFKQSPLFGNGLREQSLINIYGRSYTSHNFILELLMTGGIFQLIIFFIIVFVLIRRIQKCTYKQIKNHLTIAFVVFFISGLVGANLYGYHWFAMLTLIYSAPVFNMEAVASASVIPKRRRFVLKF